MLLHPEYVLRPAYAQNRLARGSGVYTVLSGSTRFFTLCAMKRMAVNASEGCEVKRQAVRTAGASAQSLLNSRKGRVEI